MRAAVTEKRLTANISGLLSRADNRSPSVDTAIHTYMDISRGACTTLDLMHANLAVRIWYYDVVDGTL